jgi:UDP-2,3-diacylglucosamine pyrophosphatase LpxH
MLDGHIMYDAVYISDVHLGTRQCKAYKLHNFLLHTWFKEIYIIGDFIDLTEMRKGVYWDQWHSAVVYLILSKMKSGVTVKYILGNHEAPVRDLFYFIDAKYILFKDLVIVDEASKTFIDPNGDHAVLYMTHGDGLYLKDHEDNKTICRLYNALKWINDITLLFDFSVIDLFKNTKLNKQLVERYKTEVKSKALDRLSESRVYSQFNKYVICGHNHHPEIDYRDEIVYMNCGDWVNTCSAIIEKDGNFEIVRM